MCLCPSPFSYRDAEGELQTVYVPCNNCYECQLQLQNSWKIRMIEEAKVWKYAYFFTLTYSPACLPLNVVASFPEGREVVGELRGAGASGLLLDSYEEVLSTSCKKDLQSWLKRFRSNYLRYKAKSAGLDYREVESDKFLYNKYKARFSYFITSEYAPAGEYVDRHGILRKSTQRPHYHGIIFTSIPYSEILMLFSDWRSRFGFFQMSKVRQSNNAANASSPCAHYCAKYCCKGEFSSRLDDIIDSVIEKPFRLVSKGLGFSYVERNKHIHLAKPFHMKFDSYVNLVLSRAFYFDGNYKYKLPRYYYERIFYSKIPTIREVTDFKTGVTRLQIVYRYSSRSALSVQMQVELRNRLLVSYFEKFERVKASRPSFTDDEIHAYLYDCDQRSLLSRRKVARDKLYKFYKETDFRNSSLMAC